MPLCDTGGAAKGLGHLLYAFATTSNGICCLFMVFLFSVFSRCVCVMEKQQQVAREGGEREIERERGACATGNLPN